jgi:hypothetical protein
MMELTTKEMNLLRSLKENEVKWMQLKDEWQQRIHEKSKATEEEAAAQVRLVGLEKVMEQQKVELQGMFRGLSK